MFVRFRQSGDRLQVSLVETRRVDGRVRHQHVASLGSLPSRPSVADRIEFWAKLHDRLAKLSNRIGDPGKILGQVHARIPIATIDEQRRLQLDNANEDLRHWSALQGMHAATASDHKGLIARAERVAADSEAAAAEASANAQRAKYRVERIERGEDVPGGLSKPLTYEDVVAALREAGWTDADLRRASRLAQIPKSMMKAVYAECHRRRDAAFNAAVNAIWRKSKQKPLA
jgi:hypothetical protein